MHNNECCIESRLNLSTRWKPPYICASFKQRLENQWHEAFSRYFLDHTWASKRNNNNTQVCTSWCLATCRLLLRCWLSCFSANGKRNFKSCPTRIEHQIANSTFRHISAFIAARAQLQVQLLSFSNRKKSNVVVRHFTGQRGVHLGLAIIEAKLYTYCGNNVVLLILAIAAYANAFTLSNTLGDHMVLQRDAVNPPAVVWGFADVGSSVKTTFDGKVYSATTGSDGVWRQALPQTPAGGPYKITFEGSDGSTAELNDVLFGGNFHFFIFGSCFPSSAASQQKTCIFAEDNPTCRQG